MKHCTVVSTIKVNRLADAHAGTDLAPWDSLAPLSGQLATALMSSHLVTQIQTATHTFDAHQLFDTFGGSN